MDTRLKNFVEDVLCMDVDKYTSVELEDHGDYVTVFFLTRSGYNFKIDVLSEDYC